MNLFKKKPKFEFPETPAIKGVIGQKPDGTDVMLQMGGASNYPHTLIVGGTQTDRNNLLRNYVQSVRTNTNSKKLNIIVISKNLSTLEETGLLYQPFTTRDNSDKLLITLENLEKLRAERMQTFSTLSDFEQKALYKKYHGLMHVGVSLTMYNHVVSPDKRLPEILIIIDDLNDMIENNDDASYMLERLVKIGRDAGIRVLATSSHVELANQLYRMITVNMLNQLIFKLNNKDEIDCLDINDEQRLKLSNLEQGAFLYNGQILKGVSE